MQLNGLGSNAGGNVYDQDGNPIKPRAERINGAFGNLGADDTRSFGAALWEFLNPGTVQAEYRAVGQEVPSVFKVWGSAFDDAMTAGYEAEQALGERAAQAGAGGMQMLKLVAIIATGAAIIYVLDRFVPSQGHVKRYATRSMRKARGRVGKVLTW